MKKNVCNVIHGVIGFGVMLLLWCLGAVSYYYHYTDFDFYISSIFYYLPNMALLSMPLLLMIFAFIGNRKDLKVLYFSSVIGVWLPVVAFICSRIFSDDGNILCWIYGFTLGLLFYPFHRLAWSTFGGIWTADMGVDPDFCAGFLVVGIVISYIIYRYSKPKVKQRMVNKN